MPIDQRLEHDRAEHLPARRTERPQGRELARPLRDRRRERVEDDEAADEQGEAGEGEQDLLDDRQLLVRSLRLRPRLGLAGGDLGAGGQERLDLAHERLRRDAVLRRHVDLVEPARLAEERLRGRDVEDRERQRADRVERREVGDAGDA